MNFIASILFATAIVPKKSEPSGDGDFDKSGPATKPSGKKDYSKCKYTKPECKGNILMSCVYDKENKEDCGPKKQCKVLYGKATCAPKECTFKGMKCVKGKNGKPNEVIKCSKDQSKQEVVNKCTHQEICMQDGDKARCGCTFKDQKCMGKVTVVRCINHEIIPVATCHHNHLCKVVNALGTCQRLAKNRPSTGGYNPMIASNPPRNRPTSKPVSKPTAGKPISKGRKGSAAKGRASNDRA